MAVSLSISPRPCLRFSPQDDVKLPAIWLRPPPHLTGVTPLLGLFCVPPEDVFSPSVDILIAYVRPLTAVCRSNSDFGSFFGPFRYAGVSFPLTRDSLASLVVLDNNLAHLCRWDYEYVIVNLAMVYLKDLFLSLDWTCVGFRCHCYYVMEIYVLSTSPLSGKCSGLCCHCYSFMEISVLSTSLSAGLKLFFGLVRLVVSSRGIGWSVIMFSEVLCSVLSQKDGCLDWCLEDPRSHFVSAFVADFWALKKVFFDACSAF